MEAYSANHPYYPQDVEIAKYSPNVSPLAVLLGWFGSIIAIILGASLVLARRIRPRIQVFEQLTLCWFVLCQLSEALTAKPARKDEVADSVLQADSSTASLKGISS